jgi:hypothetical protein
VLIAVGGDDSRQPMMPWRIGLAPDETGRSWIDFLDEIDPTGDGPEWVVADGAGAIADAVARRWPNANFYSCEFHLGRLIKEHARAQQHDKLLDCPVLTSRGDRRSRRASSRRRAAARRRRRSEIPQHLPESGPRRGEGSLVRR